MAPINDADMDLDLLLRQEREMERMRKEEIANEEVGKHVHAHSQQNLVIYNLTKFNY